MTVDPKNGRLKIISVDIEGNEDLSFYRHELFRLTTDTGEKYAFDLTSAQHGYYEPIVPWDSYEKLRVSKVSRRVLTFGGTQIEALKRKRRTFLEHERSRVFGYFIACLNKSLRDWQSDNVSFHTLLTLPDQHFKRKSSELYDHIWAELNRIVPTVYQRPAGR